MDGDDAAAQVSPEPGTKLASFGAIRFSAPRAQGEIVNRRGTAWGGVILDTARGDHARTDAVEYDGDVIRSNTKVTASGPGYDVRGNGLLARTDGSDIQLTGGTDGSLRMEARK